MTLEFQARLPMRLPIIRILYKTCILNIYRKKKMKNTLSAQVYHIGTFAYQNIIERPDK